MKCPLFLKVVRSSSAGSKARVTSWQIKAFSIRKLDRKDAAPNPPSTTEAQPDEASF
jgi:hypothetical protein